MIHLPPPDPEIVARRDEIVAALKRARARWRGLGTLPGSPPSMAMR